MTFQGFWLPFRSRFVLFLVGIAFLGAVSGTLHAADSPTAWDRLFGSKPKPTESAPKQAESPPKEQKSKKAKTSKEAPKKQKSSNTKKSSKEAKSKAAAQSAKESSPALILPLSEAVEASSLKAEATENQGNTAQPNTEPTSPPPAQVTTTAAPTPPVTEPSSTEPFWRRIFGGASSSQPDSKPEQVSSTEPAKEVIAAPVTASPPPAQVTTTAAPTPPVTEPSSTEPFWRRIFGGASSSQPDSKPEQVSSTEPAKEVIAAPVTATSKTSGDEEPSFWQKLFGNKPGDKKAVPSEPKLNQKPVAQGAVTPTPPPALPAPVSPAPVTPSAPITAAPPQSVADTQSSFSLATVCEREKCELMVLFDAPINKANVDKFIQSTASVPAGTVVLLNATDGDLNSGIRLGQVLRQKSFNTRVGRTQLNRKILNEIDGQCYSSCVLAFAGGVNRRIDSNDKIGIYALRSSTKTANENELKTAVNNLRIYFDQMGVDRRLVDQMLEAKGTSVSPISLSSAKALNLDNGTRISTFPWRMQALDDGLLIILVTEKQASSNFSVTLGLTKQDKEKDYRLTVYAKPLSGNANLNQLADYLNRESRLQITVSNQTLSPGLIKPWEASRSGIQTAILLTDKELTTISSALEFGLDLLQIQNNPYRLDSATIFGTSGLKGALRAIKK